MLGSELMTLKEPNQLSSKKFSYKLHKSNAQDLSFDSCARHKHALVTQKLSTHKKITTQF
jgi:hypothetical protein